MRPRRLLSNTVPQSTDPLWEAPPAPTLATDRLRAGHRTALLCAPGWEDPHRDTHQGHASQWGLLYLALHVRAIERQIIYVAVFKHVIII